jgi:MoaD family protein
VTVLQLMTAAGTITVLVPASLRDCCGGRAELTTDAANLRCLLEEMERLFPKLHKNICDETGVVRRHVNLFVNTNNMRDREGLDTPLAPGDAVTILPAVSGG